MLPKTTFICRGCRNYRANCLVQVYEALKTTNRAQLWKETVRMENCGRDMAVYQPHPRESESLKTVNLLRGLRSEVHPWLCSLSIRAYRSEIVE